MPSNDDGSPSKRPFNPRPITERLISSPTLSPPINPESTASEVVQRHLPQKPDLGTTIPYDLPGTAETHDIHKWAENERRNQGDGRRRNSAPLYPGDLGEPSSSSQGRSNPTTHPDLGLSKSVDQLKMPGGFRRQFLENQRYRNVTMPTAMRGNAVTQNFIDFLALYGHFAGDELPEDEGSEDYDDDDGSEFSRRRYPPPSSKRSRSYLSSLELRGQEEEPLLSRGMEDGSLEVEDTTTITPAPVGTASVKKVFFLLTKSFIGTGVLFLPKSFYHGGMLFSIIVLCVIAFLCLHCMLLLIECRNKVPGSFGDIGGHLYGPHMKSAVLASIAISQIGFSCAYTIFVATTMQDLIMLVTECEIIIPITYLIFFQLLVYVPLAMIRKIKHLSHAALIADIFIIFGIGYLYYYDFFVLSTRGVAPNIPLVNLANMSLFIGTAIFTFEGIGLVIPIVESMREPEKFPKVLSWTTLLMVIIFLSVGAISYAAFGEEVETVVLLNLPTGDPTVILVQFLYTLAIVFSVPLQLFPAIGIVEQHLLFPPETTVSGKFDPIVKWQKNVFRASAALVVAMIAWVGADSLDRVVSIIGSFACLPLSFIYPAIFHYRLVARTRWQRFSDIALAIFGVLMMIFVTEQTIATWGTQVKTPNRCERINIT